MSQTIVIRGSVHDVEYFDAPKNDGSGDARFYDASGATASAADVRDGVPVITKDGLTTGTMAERSASDITMSGATASIPEGHYAATTKKVADTTGIDLKPEHVVAGHKGLDANLRQVAGTAVLPVIAYDASTKTLRIS